MGFTYAVVGAGRQGTAAAYDFALRGKAEDVLLADLDLKRAKAAADRVDGLVGTTLARGVRVDVTRQDSVLRALKGVDVFLSAARHVRRIYPNRAWLNNSICSCYVLVVRIRGPISSATARREAST